MIDLQKYCSTDSNQPTLHHPFSGGDYSYATNGHVAIRIPRRDDIPERDGSPSIEKIFTDITSVSRYERVPAFEFQPVTHECDGCNGGWGVHDCPDCRCERDDCDGTGKIEEQVSACFYGTFYNAKYLTWLRELGAELGIPATLDGLFMPVPFRFDGGDGLLMRMNGPYNKHLGEIASEVTT